MADDDPLIGPGNPTYDETFRRVTEHREAQFAASRAKVAAFEEAFMKLRQCIDATKSDAGRSEFHRGWAACCEMVNAAIDIAFKEGQ